jgi:hypothetical protein
VQERKIVKLYTLKLLFYILFGLIATDLAIAEQVESPVDCIEGNEPTQLAYSDHTVGCAFESQTDLDRFEFYGTAGDQIRINVISTSGHVDPSIEVIDPNLTIVGSMACMNHLCTYSLALTLTDTGLYTILASDSEVNEAGNYTLQLEKIQPDAHVTHLDYDSPQAETFSPQTDIDFFTFTGMVGTKLRINAVSTSGHVDPTIEVRDPSGTLILNGLADGASCNNHLCSYSVDLPALTETGTYSLLIYDHLINEAGGYQLSLWCLDGPCDSNGDGASDPHAPLISYVTPVADSFSHLVDGDFFTFNVTPDSEIRLNVISTSGHVDPTVEIRDPTGLLILNGAIDGATCNNHLCTYSITLPISLTETGLYSLLVYDNEINESGDYQLSLWCVVGACDSDADGVADGDHINLNFDDETAVTLSPYVDGDIFRFLGAAGDMTRLNVLSTSGHVDPTVEIRDPNGDVLINGVGDGASCNNHGCSYTIDLPPLPSTGVYSLLIYDMLTNEVGSSNIGLQCLSGVCDNLAESYSGDNCIDVPNGPLIPDAGGNIQLDTDGDNIGNICDPDFNNNDVIDPSDFSQLKAVFGAISSDEDLNGNGVVDPSDFSRLKAYFGSAPGPACPAL